MQRLLSREQHYICNMVGCQNQLSSEVSGCGLRCGYPDSWQHKQDSYQPMNAGWRKEKNAHHFCLCPAHMELGRYIFHVSNFYHCCLCFGAAAMLRIWIHSFSWVSPMCPRTDEPTDRSVHILIPVCPQPICPWTDVSMYWCAYAYGTNVPSYTKLIGYLSCSQLNKSDIFHYWSHLKHKDRLNCCQSVGLQLYMQWNISQTVV